MSDKQFRRLPRRQRNATRSVARDVYFELSETGRPFDFARAEELLANRLRSVIGAIFLSLALKLAIELIKYWLANRVTEPAAIYEIGEPGNCEMGGDDAG